MKTIIYIDGFNLYYGVIRKHNLKWIDLSLLCHNLFPGHDIRKIKYFTARISSVPSDPQRPTRQQIYLRALQTKVDIEIIEGHFIKKVKNLPIAGCKPIKQQFLDMELFEEKGSDVNIGTHMVNDGYRHLYDWAILASNDSDLEEPARVVVQDLGLKLGILGTQDTFSKSLIKYTNFVKPIRDHDLRNSQFPQSISDKHGKITKPEKW